MASRNIVIKSNSRCLKSALQSSLDFSFLVSQFKRFNETRGWGWCPGWECRFSRVTSSFLSLPAVCPGKLLVFMQDIISIEFRFYGSPVYTFWCLV